MIIEIGIIINIITLILFIVCCKTTTYIDIENICEYNDKHEPISVNSWTTWDKAWDTIKLPLWQYVVLIMLIAVPYLGAVLYILFAYCYVFDEINYYYKKSIFFEKLISIVKLITIEI